MRSLIVAVMTAALCLADAAHAIADNCIGSDPQINKKGFAPGTTVRYSFAPGFPEAMKPAVRAAFDQWQLANNFTHLDVKFAEGGSDIQLTMVDQSVLENPSAAGGSVRQPPNWGAPATGGEIRFTTNTQWLDSYRGFYKVALHELGHLHGLADRGSTDGKSVMNQFKGKNDSGEGVRGAPSACDATKANVASNFYGGPANINDPICPTYGCVGFDPFPPPCPNYDIGDGWCYPTNQGFNTTSGGFQSSYAPQVVIVAPTNGAVISAGTAIQVRVASGDRDGRVMVVDYYVNGQRQYSTAGHPFTWSVAPPAGQYTIQAVAWDNQRIYGVSGAVTVTVSGSGGGGGGGGAGTSVLLPGQQLTAGQWLYSPNRAYGFTYQNDGNVVLYGPGGASWASNAIDYCPGSLQMQGDGNLVAYNCHGVPYWHTATFWNNSMLQLQDDGHVVIYAPGGTPVWRAP